MAKNSFVAQATFNNRNVNMSLSAELKVSMEKCLQTIFNPIRANPTKWSSTLKQFVGKSQRIV